MAPLLGRGWTGCGIGKRCIVATQQHTHTHTPWADGVQQQGFGLDSGGGGGEKRLRPCTDRATDHDSNPPMTGLVCAIRMGKHLTERGVGEERELNGDHLLETREASGGMLLGVRVMGWGGRTRGGGGNAKLCEWEKNSGTKCKIEMPCYSGDCCQQRATGTRDER